MFDILESGFADVRFACFGPRVRPTKLQGFIVLSPVLSGWGSESLRSLHLGKMRARLSLIKKTSTG